MRSLMLQIMLFIPGQQFLIKKASYLSHKFVVCHAAFLIFSNHPNITILLLLLFLRQHESSLHIFLRLYFCVFSFLCVARHSTNPIVGLDCDRLFIGLSHKTSFSPPSQSK